LKFFCNNQGDPHDLPTLVMDPSFKGGIGLIDSDEYLNGPNEIWTNQNNFYRQIRNFNIDLTRVPPGNTATGIHWQVAQATSITNVHFKMSKAANNNHQGIWMENGSGGFMSDLTFEGGKYGLWVGNQQFTSRNLTIRDAQTGIYMNWNWGWTFKGIKIENCQIGKLFFMQKSL
jgi:glucan 1,3-beta-glucosidase